MKALSIRQPWAHAVLHLGKRVENRDWSGCSYRGPVLLHASKTLVLRDFDEEIESILDVVDPPEKDLPKLVEPLAFRRGGLASLSPWRPAPTLPLGGIVGRARIVGVVGPHELHAMPMDGSTCPCRSPWYTGGFALVLADVEPLPFIPWKGSLGFFDVPDDVVEKAVEQERADRALAGAASWAVGS